MFSASFRKRSFKATSRPEKSSFERRESRAYRWNKCARYWTGGGFGQSVELVPGDITLTVPEYVKAKPELRISLLNLDTDIYEPAVTILDHLFPRIVRGGILILDDYGTFPGETKAVDSLQEHACACSEASVRDDPLLCG